MKRSLFVLLVVLLPFLGSCKKEIIEPDTKVKVSVDKLDKSKTWAPFIDPRGGDGVITPLP